MELVTTLHVRTVRSFLEFRLFLMYITDRSSKLGGEYGLTAWGVSEIFVIIVTGCIPTLKPIYDQWFSDHKSKDKSFQLSDTGKTNYRTVALDGYINLPEGNNTTAKLKPLPKSNTPAGSPIPYAGDVDEDTRHSPTSIDHFRPTAQSPVTHAYAA